VAAFIACQRRDHAVPHAVTCRALGVSQSWFYKWKDRPPTARAHRRGDLTARVEASFVCSGGTYGSPRVTDDLHDDGVKVSVNTIAEIMRANRWQGRKPPRRHCLTRSERRVAISDKVHRNFNSVAPNVLWVGDQTEIITGEGKLYLATVIDMFARRALGFAFSNHHDADLAVAALQQAAARRGGGVDGVIFHSDRGSEYTAEAIRSTCERLGITQSMSRVGSCFDNACAEAFNSIIKVEFIHRRTFATRAQAIVEISGWINGFYNPRRRHGANNNVAPIEFEQYMAAARRAASPADERR
jgi:transposase InsO family protein